MTRWTPSRSVDPLTDHVCSTSPHGTDEFRVCRCPAAYSFAARRNVALFESQPDAKEIQAERVKFLRYGKARGTYGDN
jgi:hypothetical protein